MAKCITKKSFKAINFDLSERMLIEMFSITTYRNAWVKMRKCLNNKGWSRRQYSGYVSDEKVDYFQVYDLLDYLTDNIPNIMQCLERFDVTDIMDVFDLIQPISERLKVDKINFNF